jgi:hypothetical protein
MKLQHILDEMAYKTTTQHPEFPQEQVDGFAKWIQDGSVAHPVEGGKFKVLQKEFAFALFRARDEALLGWVLLDAEKTEYGISAYPLKNIQILPKYRNTAAIVVLINAMRLILNRPVLIDNPIFSGGQSLLKAIIARPDTMPRVKTINKRTGEVKQYTDMDLVYDDTIAVLLEQLHWKLTHCDILPGGYSRDIVLEFFSTYTTDLI